MASSIEVRTNHKKTLFALLKLKKDNASLHIVGLKELIIGTIAEMEAEDVAYVEKMVEQL